MSRVSDNKFITFVTLCQVFAMPVPDYYPADFPDLLNFGNQISCVIPVINRFFVFSKKLIAEAIIEKHQLITMFKVTVINKKR